MKRKKNKPLNLNKELKDLETQHKREQKTSLLTKMKKVRNKIYLIYLQEIEKIISTKRKYYESGLSKMNYYKSL